MGTPEDICVREPQIISTKNLTISNDLVYVGKTKRGHLIEINRWVMESEFKIGFGGIIPHAFGGYSGGAKSILPGVASRETIIQNHVVVTDPKVGMGSVEGNPIREEME